MKDRMEMQRLMSSGGSEEQQKALMLRIVMEQSRSSDKMFEKLGVDDVDLKKAIEKHQLQKDPEFNKITTEFMTKMQTKAM